MTPPHHLYISYLYLGVQKYVYICRITLQLLYKSPWNYFIRELPATNSHQDL